MFFISPYPQYWFVPELAGHKTQCLPVTAPLRSHPNLLYLLFLSIHTPNTRHYVQLNKELAICFQLSISPRNDAAEVGLTPTDTWTASQPHWHLNCSTHWHLNCSTATLAPELHHSHTDTWTAAQPHWHLNRNSHNDTWNAAEPNWNLNYSTATLSPELQLSHTGTW
jgi:hypothetical protein